MLISDTHREKLCFTQFIVEEFIEIETSLLLTFSRCLHNELSSILSIVQGRRNGFQSGGAMEHWKGMSATMVGRQEKCSNSRRSRMAKTVTFWLWWQPFNSFCFETLFSFFPQFSFCYKKKLCVSGGEQALLSHMKEYKCLKKMTHQIDSKNGRLSLSASFTAKFEVVFVLT